MLNVLLICSMGASTAVLCDKIKVAAEKDGFDMDISATAIVGSNDKVEKADIVLLGPQVRYMLKKVQEQTNGKPTESIDMLHYGMMDGDKVFEQIKKMAASQESK